MSESQPSQETLNKILTYFNQENIIEAEELAKSLIKNYSNNIFLLKILGVIYSKQGKFDKALEYIKKVISINPKDPEGYNNLGICYKNSGRIQDSIASFEKAISLNSRYADAYYNLSNVYELAGKDNLSFEANLKAVNYGSKNIKPYIQLSEKMMHRGRNDDAIVYLDHARSIDSKDPELGICYSDCLSKLERYDEAIKCLENVLKHDPNNSDVHNNIGSLLMDQGQPHEALLAFEKAISLNKNNARSSFNMAQIKKYNTDDPHLSLMRKLYQSNNLNKDDRCLLSFALGKAYEDIGDIQKEFLYLKEGNAIRRNQVKYDEANDINEFIKLRSNIPEINRHSLNINDIDVDIVPIFIVGMPRSGTTLVEQILSSDDNIRGCNELPYISQFGAEISLGLAKPTKQNLMNFRHNYLKKINIISKNSKMMIDKMPFNFKYLSIIISAFPEAKIIHINRRPEAICWSIYKKCFSRHAIALNFAYDLYHIKNYFLRYIDLMKLYSEHFSNRIFELDYDVLVNNQEIITKNLINHLDLEWDNRFLFPEKNQRSVRTASNLQVRKKIYKGSSEVWEKYKPFLNGAFDDLEKYN